MFRLTTLLAGGLAAFFTVAVVSAQDAPPAEYVEAMGTIRAAMQAANAEGAPDFAAIADAANEARDAFLYVQTYWRERDDEDAAELAGDASRSAASLAVSANLMSAEGVQFAAMEMGMTCGTCHMAHRVRTEDGSFAIQ
jgi:hypothetical protein